MTPDPSVEPASEPRPLRILVRRRIGLGDVIWTTPVIRALAHQHRPCTIDVATAYPDVFLGNPWVSAVYPAGHPSAGYDRVIDLNFAYERRRHLHVLAAYADEAGVAIADPRPALALRPGDYGPVAAALAERNWATLGIERIVALHMAATSRDRIWPSGHWKAFILSLLRRPEVGLVVVGHRKDFDMQVAMLREPFRHRIASLVRTCALHQTAAAIALSDVLVAPDSGLSHVAAAVGTRAVVLYGMTDPANYLPPHGGAEGIWSPVECRGCIADIPPRTPPLCRFGDAFCYDRILPETVIAATERVLDGLPEAPGWRTRLALAAGTDGTRANVAIPAETTRAGDTDESPSRAAGPLNRAKNEDL